ncbi:MAG: sugar phosphate isomerase/epimerase [Actinomycetota bacterium]|nr:sugar phosphate isomerase/epimerase [Actinomycetota bacterium]
MVNLSAFPKCWIEDITKGKMTLYKWMEISTELKCDGLEMYFRFLKSHEIEYLKDLRNKAESLGMEIPMMCYSPDFTFPDKDLRKKEVKKQIEMIKVIAELGGKYCRTLSGQFRPEITITEGIKWVVECIESCLPTAEKYGVNLVIENHYKDDFWKNKEFAQNKEIFLSIINRIESPYFGVQYDPSNAIVAGDDPIDLLKILINRVKTMHASDRSISDGNSIEHIQQYNGKIGYPDELIHGVIGEGVIDYDSIFSILSNSKFNGWISIEDGMNGFEEMKKSVIFLKKMIKKYFKSDK